MGKLRYRFALLMAKAAIPALKLTGHKGTDFPGTVANKICPDFLRYIDKPKFIIGITGTNGKTTISNLLTDSLTALGRPVLNNGAGSNAIDGVTTCLIKGTNFFGKQRHKEAVLEIDERSTRLICPYVKPDYFIVSNLSRDSIMRTGHPQFVRDIVSQFIPKESKLLLNADDLNASSVAPANPRKYYGIEKMAGDLTESRNIINDVVICPKCSARLKFEYIRYSNIGKVYCPACGFKAPEYDFAAFDVDKEAMTMGFRGEGKEGRFPLLNEGTFNIYNQVAVIAMLQELGYSYEEIAKAMHRDDVGIAKTRYDDIEVNGSHVRTMLCKGLNGYAASRVAEYIKAQPGDKEIIIMTNSLDAKIHWSEDTCWIYDWDLELLAEDRVKQWIVFGDRGTDYKLRLLYAGVPEERITRVQKMEEMPEKLQLFKNDNIYVLYDLDIIQNGLDLAKQIADMIREKEA